MLVVWCVCVHISGCLQNCVHISCVWYDVCVKEKARGKKYKLRENAAVSVCLSITKISMQMRRYLAKDVLVF